MKTHRKVPKKCHFSPFGLNCGSETAFQARISGPHLRPASQARISGPHLGPASQARISGPHLRPAFQAHKSEHNTF